MVLEHDKHPGFEAFFESTLCKNRFVKQNNFWNWNKYRCLLTSFDSNRRL